MAYKTFVNGFPLNASEINNNLMNQVISTFATEAARTSAISAPVEGQITYLESTEKFYKFDSSAWVELPGFESQVSQAISPNYIINGAFDIWQRGTSTTTTSAGYRSADRWASWIQSGSGTISQTTADIPDEIRYGIKFEASSAGSLINYYHTIETADTIPLAGKTVTVSFYVAGSSATRSLALYGSSSVDVAFTGSFTQIGSNLDVTPTATPTRYSATFSVPATTRTLQVRFFGSALASGQTVTITGVQLEAGSVATPFRRHAPSLQGELAACQRYYQEHSVAIHGVFRGANDCVTFVTFPTEMRATPSVTVTGLTIAAPGFGDSTATSVGLAVGATAKAFGIAYLGCSPTRAAGVSAFAKDKVTFSAEL